MPKATKEFLKNFPASWDDTKLIDGFPGEKVIMARKKNDLWYIGGLNGKDIAQTLTLNFDFLENGNYELLLITDGKDDKSLDSKILNVKKGETIKIDCLSRGGFAGVLKVK